GRRTRSTMIRTSTTRSFSLPRPCRHEQTNKSRPMPAMIEISNAEKTFTMHLQGGVKLPVVRGVNFEVHPGECVVLSGPSGAGKSSILKMIFGNYRCDGGLIGIHHRGKLIDLAKAEP